MKRKVIFNLFEIITLIFLLYTSYAWFGVVGAGAVVPFATNIFLGVGLILLGAKLEFTPRTFVQIFLLGCILIVMMICRDFRFAFNQLLMYLPAIYIFLLPGELKEKLLKFVTKWFAIAVAVSLLIYIALKFVRLPAVLPPIPGNKIADSYPYFYNYLFYLKPGVAGTGIVRFQGFFLEPGHLAINCVMFIAGNNYDFKNNRYIWVITAALLISLSLAGYVLFVLGWIMLKVKDITSIISTLVASIFVVFMLQFWNGGDNPLSNQIFARLELDTHKGIKGNNRVNSRTNNMFNITVNSEQIFFGMENAYAKKPFGAGYKKFIVLYGIVPIFVIFAFYASLTSPHCRRRYAMGFYILLFLTFLDCEYTFWFSWMLCYICGTASQRTKAIRQNKTEWPELEDMTEH